MKIIGNLTSMVVIPIVALMMIVACSTPSTPTQTKASTQPESGGTGSPSESTEPSEGDDPVEELAAPTELPTRTPEPTFTPGTVEIAVQGFAETVGVEDVVFLGLTGEDWINIGISILIVLFGAVITRWLIGSLLENLTKRTVNDLDDRLLAQSKRQLTWLILAIFLELSLLRLQFLDPVLKKRIQDLFFVIYIAISLVIVWRLIGLVLDELRRRFLQTMDANQADSLVTLVAWLIRVTALLIFTTILLDHFGISITAMTAALGIGGLALSLAAQDTIADAIAGVLILVDQPFRIGDRIEIQEIDTWGDVVEIGLRTTRIRTRDNRLVIVPNSKIGSGTVVNYTYPDPNYRIQIEVGIGYGQDIDHIREVIQNAVQQVEGVNPDMPVDALFLEFAPSDMKFRVRWWIDSYIDTRRMFDKVNQAMYEALEAEGIEMPFTTYDVNIHVDGEGRNRLSGMLDADRGKD